MVLSLEEFSKSSKKPRRSRCAFAVVVDALDAKDAGVLAAALADPSITSPGIVAVLKANGHVLSPAQIDRHRRGECVTCGS